MLTIFYYNSNKSNSDNKSTIILIKFKWIVTYNKKNKYTHSARAAGFHEVGT